MTDLGHTIGDARKNLTDTPHPPERLVDRRALTNAARTAQQHPVKPGARTFVQVDTEDVLALIDELEWAEVRSEAWQRQADAHLAKIRRLKAKARRRGIV